MNGKRIAVVTSLALVSAIGGYQLKAHAQQQPKQFPYPCTVLIPADWGEYAGTATGAGMVFEDSSGTLRIISDIPCSIDGGVSGTPRIIAEIRRK